MPVDQNGSIVAKERRIGFSLSFFATSVCLAFTSATPNNNDMIVVRSLPANIEYAKSLALSVSCINGTFS